MLATTIHIIPLKQAINLTMAMSTLIITTHQSSPTRLAIITNTIILQCLPL